MRERDPATSLRPTVRHFATATPLPQESYRELPSSCWFAGSRHRFGSAFGTTTLTPFISGNHDDLSVKSHVVSPSLSHAKVHWLR